jgi:cyclopropane fatty-acyl-phospholipid synthase-like methyltransferase
MDIFFELHRDLPREGPGDNPSTRKALSLLADLPPQPLILDIGCGPGMQTIELARCTNGKIIAIDTHQPFLDKLKQRAKAESLSDRITTINISMFALDFDTRSFDAIWSEGAIYIMGFEGGLRACQPLLKPKGYVAVTEISWLRPQPPSEVDAFWAANYPGMRTVQENLEIVQVVGYRQIEHFVLPSSAWWDDYYTPQEARIAMLREKYRDNVEAIRLLDESQLEMDLYRKYSDWYGYVFYVMQNATA